MSKTDSKAHRLNRSLIPSASRPRQVPQTDREVDNLPAPVPDQGRPTAFTVICVLLGLLLAYNVVILIKDPGRISGWAWLVNILTLALGVASIVGLWTIKKWGAHAYTACFILNLVFFLIAIFEVGRLLVPLLVIMLVIFTPLAVLMFIIYRNFKYLN